MGGKKRSKFDRIYSDNENSSSESDEDILEVGLTDEEEKEFGNTEITDNQGKNSNSNSSNNKVVSEKFLVTRSKRKYKKREINSKDSGSCKKQEENVSNISPETGKISVSKNGNPSKSKKLDKLDNSEENEILQRKILNAKAHLEELNDLIRERDKQINDLKNHSKSVSESSHVSPKRGKQIETVVTPIICSGRTDGQKEREEAMDEETENFDDVEQLDRAETEYDLKIKKRKKRSRSRERGKQEDEHQRRKHKKRSRSRSRSRKDERTDDHDDLESHYRSDPLVQQIVKKMVSEQIEAASKRNSGRYPVEKLKSPSDSTLYTPAMNRIGKNLEHLYKPIPENWNSNEIDIQLNSQTINTKRINDMISDLRLGVQAAKERSVDINKIQQGGPGTSSDGRNDRRSAADEAILDAERFKAQIQQPTNRGIDNVDKPNFDAQTNIHTNTSTTSTNQHRTAT